MANWIDVSMLGSPDYDAIAREGGMVCPDSGTGEAIDNGWGCYRQVKPLSAEAMAIWKEVEAALNQELLADWDACQDDNDLGLGWNNMSQS
jgi:hypothetical protein